MKLSTYIICRYGRYGHGLSAYTRKLSAVEHRANRVARGVRTHRALHIRNVLAVFHTTNPTLFKLGDEKM